MYKDIISYELAEGIDEAHLLKVSSEIIESWMSKQTGFIRWEINKNVNDNTFTDIVFWESKEDAKKSEQQMMDIPNAADWMACYKEGSINCLNIEELATFK